MEFKVQSSHTFHLKMSLIGWHWGSEISRTTVVCALITLVDCTNFDTGAPAQL